MIYLQLFLSFLQVGMFSFGGGYAAMPLIQGQVVTADGFFIFFVGIEVDRCCVYNKIDIICNVISSLAEINLCAFIF